MKVRALAVEGAYEFTPSVFPDDRGLFLNPYIADVVAETVGHPLTLAQTNHSVSRRGVLRGLHFALLPPSQAKYVYCAAGAGLDVVVDLRIGSPTFGQHDVVTLDDVHYRSVYLPEGLGHAFLALTDGTVLNYLCSTGYDPSREKGINPLDPELGLPWPADLDLVLSAKGQAAPSLAEAREQGLLASYQDCQAFYASLRSSTPSAGTR